MLGRSMVSDKSGLLLWLKNFYSVVELSAHFFLFSSITTKLPIGLTFLKGIKYVLPLSCNIKDLSGIFLKTSGCLAKCIILPVDKLNPLMSSFLCSNMNLADSLLILITHKLPDIVINIHEVRGIINTSFSISGFFTLPI